MMDRQRDMKIGIVNYGLTNLGSIYSAFKFYNYDVSLVNRPDELDKIDIIVLGGVGNFGAAVSKLKETRFWDKLDDEVMNKKKPVLGICLGMQLFAETSYEDGDNKGFGWIKGKVVKLNGTSIRVPHIGWNEVRPEDGSLFKNIRYGFFYFMHSYHLIPENKDTIAATTNYGDVRIISALRHNNVFGVQFHPEKSQGDGLRFLKNFVGQSYDSK